MEILKAVSKMRKKGAKETKGERDNFEYKPFREWRVKIDPVFFRSSSKIIFHISKFIKLEHHSLQISWFCQKKKTFNF